MDSDALIAQLKEEGFKYTGKRKALIDLFVEHKSHYLTVRDVYELCQENYPNISLDTIYRNVSLLEELNVIERLEFNDLATRYRLKCRSGHHHHAVCTLCGFTQELTDCPIPQVEGQLEDFQMHSHKLEIYGVCKSCQSK